MSATFDVPVGTRFGLWTTTSVKYKPEGKRDNYIDVVCDCGYARSIYGSALTSGVATQCRSCYDANRPGYVKVQPRQYVLNTVFRNYAKAASMRGREFILTKNEVELLIFGDCHYCGATPKNKCTDRSKHGRDFPKYNGIDRVDNLRGYTSDNVVTACNWCNQAKRAKTPEEFDTWMKGLIQNYCGTNRASVRGLRI